MVATIDVLNRHPLEIDESVRRDVCMDVLALHSSQRPKQPGTTSDDEIRALFKKREEG